MLKGIAQLKWAAMTNPSWRVANCFMPLWYGFSRECPASFHASERI
jgi:hypothetical protein